ncbi:hypothetical protein [Mucilaginibacter gotjawali]|uniref:Uncharacterized protein n=2 Tax=Mucilaginibacter gotjawali TaxID=1550579 RepID=A0A839SJB6_9SPHI|nr:hypothetical protein [Mucilaginibacter gotjawali]MBB3057522.1 hypothetical protein [Mucilaginibacter gotjawali]BAU55357.1 hypothetical protein MgSA37_03541 [Mucilaginibacter gotjawali]
MKKEFYPNVFLFPVLSQFLKQVFCEMPVYQLIKYVILNNDIFGVNQPVLVRVKSNIVSQVNSLSPTVSLAPV